MQETKRVLKRLFKICGSIYFGAALMAVLAVAMGWATFIEREMGTPVAQRIIYAANWFYFLIALLGFNILCSAFVRAPRFVRREKIEPAVDGENGTEPAAPRFRIRIERKLIPFYLAHLGVLLLLIGCWTTAKFGVQARTIIPEGTAVEKAIDVDSRLFEIEISDAANPDAAPKKIEIPFSGGPLNWRDLASAKNWNANVAASVLEPMSEKSFFQRLGKGAARWSQRAAFWAAKIAQNRSSGTLYDDGEICVDVLDYSTCADYAPVAPLKLELKTRKPAADGDPESVLEKREVELTFPFDAAAQVDGDPLATSRRARRSTLPGGTRIVYVLADSNAELEALARLAPEKAENAATDCVVLSVDGKRCKIALSDLEPLSRSGDPAEQRIPLETQRNEIARRLKIERDRAADSAFDASKEKPLQTVADEELVASNKTLGELSAKTAKLAEDAEKAAAERGENAPRLPESSELRDARREFVKARILNYLTSTWARLESATPTSAEFCETLEKMAAQNDERLAEVERLEAVTRLGDSGWKIVAFEISPTLVSGVDELQGWTAALQLQSPQGVIYDATLFSELSERNRYSDGGRIFGALWLSQPKGDDNEYGRPWNAALDKPKLELIQSASGALLCRYADAKGGVQTTWVVDVDGKNALKPRSLGDDGSLAFDGEIALKNVENAPFETIESVAIRQLAFQDELGARLVPTPFKKDVANEFYGKAKIRVSVGDATPETFWLRTIPLESATDDHLKYLTKTLSVESNGARKTAKIRFVDREFPLGAALFVKKFTPVYEPGSSTAASFSSVVRVLDAGLSPEEQTEIVVKSQENDVCIQMNRPGVLKSPNSELKYWAYQDSFRGPFKPGDAEFDKIVDGRLLPGESTPRASLYYTIITLNADPGRGMKYLGALFVVWGTALLVYRKKKKGAKTVETDKDETALSVESKGVDATMKNEKTNLKSSTFVAFFVASLLAASTASAQDSSQVLEKETVKTMGTAPANVRTDALDWTAWRLLPIFDGGRRQPLEAFAKILVRDVCGTETPTIAVPPEIFERLESGKPLNFPELDEFVKDVDGPEKEKQIAWYSEVSATVVARQKEIAAKLRAVFPNGPRKFSAAELLFSWIVEPEIWEFVPFLDDPKGEIARNALKRQPLEIAKRLGRIAPEDFETQDVKTKRYLIDDYRAVAQKTSESAQKNLADVRRRLEAFRSVSFTPTRTASTRPRFYLNKILFGAPSTGPSAFHSAASSLLSRLDASTRTLESLLPSEDSALRKTSPLSDKEFLLRKTTPLSGESSRAASRSNGNAETLLLARQINLLASVYADYPLAKTGPLFEQLYVSTSVALDELTRHRDEIFAAETFSKEYRQEIQRVASLLSEIVDNIELAYLSLAVEPPKTLAVVPLIRRGAFRLTESQETPWVALQTLLWAPDSLYSRFVDPSFAPDALGLRETPSVSAEIAKKIRADKDANADAATVSPFATFDEALRQTLDSSRFERDAATAFLDAANVYRDKTSPDRAERFNVAIQRFADETRALADRSEPLRTALANEEIDDARARAEFLAKTAYSAPGALDAEFFYYRLNPFFWNWVACLLAVVAFGASYLRQLVRRVRAWSETKSETSPRAQVVETKRIASTKKRGRKTRSGPTSFVAVAESPQKAPRTFPQETFFFSLGLIFLAASVVVAFWGGAIRAYITGWAPVTNMFETVVLLALLIAAIAIGFALYPIWGEPFGAAWRASAFPISRRDAAPEERRISQLLAIPRLAITVLCVVATAKICYSEEVFGRGLVETILESFAMQGILDRFAVVATFAFVAWSVPRFLVATAALAIFPKTLFPEVVANEEVAQTESNGDKPETAFRRIARFCRDRYSEVVQRKGFLTSSAIVAFLVAAAAYFNSSEFNPNIRPLVAVLRSNFWLTIHVFAIIISYALASIAWIVSLTSLAAYIFGKYSPSAAATDDWEPAYCRRVAPILATMIRSAVLFLTVGIILGARWADFSWGRFWSWDPKEVWALVTLLIYLVVLHLLKSRSGKRFGLAVGATLGALAVVTTWYGLSFVMGGGGRHAYAAGESNKVAVLYVAFALNVGWAALATARYAFEKSRRKAAQRFGTASEKSFGKRAAQEKKR